MKKVQQFAFNFYLLFKDCIFKFHLALVNIFYTIKKIFTWCKFAIKCLFKVFLRKPNIHWNYFKWIHVHKYSYTIKKVPYEIRFILYYFYLIFSFYVESTTIVISDDVRFGTSFLMILNFYFEVNLYPKTFLNLY